MDRLSKEHRSWNMSRIRAQNTSPELLVRSMLHSAGYRFRLHRRDLPGSPDIVLPKHKLAFFVHGCFWHRHARCRLAAVPKSRPDFWRKKFSDNVKRDRRAVSQLTKMGWRVCVIWECETRDLQSLVERLAAVLPEVPKRRTIAAPPGVHSREGRGNWGSNAKSRRRSPRTRRTLSNR
jgi:DNA mismatch endonuclease (patch repair protein)